MSEKDVKLKGNNDSYIIQLKNFEGPFDLLFHLIEKNKLDIYDISISEITDKYMEHILKIRKLDLEIASEFIIMASTLLYIKSKSLLPSKKDEEKLDIDSKDELILRLIEYKKYKNISTIFKERIKIWSKAYYKEPDNVKCDNSNNKLSLDKMIYVYKRMLQNNLRSVNNDENKMVKILKKDKVTVGQKIKDIIRRLIKKSSFKFKEVFGKKTKIEIITGFMAILELIKLNKITVIQEKPFDDIIVNKNLRDEELENYIKGGENDGGREY